MTDLGKLKAKDIMKTDVVRLDASAPIAEAIGTLEDLEITGAPVVDPVGKLLGVLSTSDVSRAEHVRASRLDPERGDFAMSEPTDEDTEEGSGEDVIFGKEDYSPALLAGDTVADWMSPRVVTVDPEATLKEVCRRMLAEHIHRVIVAKDRKLLGIITSYDIVRCVAGGA